MYKNVEFQRFLCKSCFGTQIAFHHGNNVFTIIALPYSTKPKCLIHTEGTEIMILVKLLPPWILIFKRQILLREPFEKYFPSCAFPFLGYSVQGSFQFHNSGEGSYDWDRGSEREEAQSYKDLGLLPSRKIQSHVLIPNYLKFLSYIFLKLVSRQRRGYLGYLDKRGSPTATFFGIVMYLPTLHYLLFFKFSTDNVPP